MVPLSLACSTRSMVSSLAPQTLQGALNVMSAAFPASIGKALGVLDAGGGLGPGGGGGHHPGGSRATSLGGCAADVLKGCFGACERGFAREVQRFILASIGRCHSEKFAAHVRRAGGLQLRPTALTPISAGLPRVRARCATMEPSSPRFSAGDRTHGQHCGALRAASRRHGRG